jgi:hypothetical protein
MNDRQTTSIILILIASFIFWLYNTKKLATIESMLFNNNGSTTSTGNAPAIVTGSSNTSGTPAVVAVAPIDTSGVMNGLGYQSTLNSVSYNTGMTTQYSQLPDTLMQPNDGLLSLGV